MNMYLEVGVIVESLSVLYFSNGIFMCLHVFKCDLCSVRYFSFICLSLKMEKS